MQAPVYLCLLGNDPAPAYLGLKVVEREAGRVAKAVFYSFPGNLKRLQEAVEAYLA